jgi:hypothetical protein
MSWLVAYFAIAAASLIVVLAMFKVGSDADARVPLIPPDHDWGDRAEAATAVAPSSDRPRTAENAGSAALPVVEAASTDLSRPTEKDEKSDELLFSSSRYGASAR